MQAGCAKMTVLRLEHAPPTKGLATIESLARVLGVPPGWLAFGDGE